MHKKCSAIAKCMTIAAMALGLEITTKLKRSRTPELLIEA
jgi:hypothetical protein